MKKALLICLLTIQGFCHTEQSEEAAQVAYQQEMIASREEISSSSKEMEEVALDSLDKVTVRQNEIFIDLNGNCYPIHSLTKHGNQWIAQYDTRYCPKGDPLCRFCGLCHRAGCWYYVVPCWQ